MCVFSAVVKLLSSSARVWVCETPVMKMTLKWHVCFSRWAFISCLLLLVRFSVGFCRCYVIFKLNRALTFNHHSRSLWKCHETCKKPRLLLLFSPILTCACVFCSILAEAKNLSFNATAAFKAYTNIKNYIDEADKVAKMAKKASVEAQQLVRKHTHSSWVSTPVADGKCSAWAEAN